MLSKEQQSKWIIFVKEDQQICFGHQVIEIGHGQPPGKNWCQ